MPNQRHKDKRGISVYVPTEIKDALTQEAEAQGVPMSELIIRIYRDALSQRGYKVNGDKECKQSK